MPCWKPRVAQIGRNDNQMNMADRKDGPKSCEMSSNDRNEIQDRSLTVPQGEVHQGMVVKTVGGERGSVRGNCEVDMVDWPDGELR